MTCLPIVGFAWLKNCPEQHYTLGWICCTDKAFETNSGGWEWWAAYEHEMYEREKALRKRQKRRKKAEKIKDDLIRAIALAERDLEEEASRKRELAKLTLLAYQYQDSLNKELGRIIQEAVERQTFSAMERMEREIKRAKEDEEHFLIVAAQILFRLI